MFKGLYRQLALVLLLLFLCLGAFLFWLFDNTNEDLHDETTQKLRLNLADHLVKEVPLFENGALKPERVKSIFSQVMMLDPATELYIIDPKGTVLAYDAPDEKIKRNKIDIAPILSFLNKSNALPILGNDPRTEQEKIFSVAPINSDAGELQGYLYIIIGGEIYDQIATTLRVNKTWQLSLISIAVALVFLLLTALLLFYKMTRPLARLSREMAEFEASKFTQLPHKAQSLLAQETDEVNEVQHLQGSFYRMGERLIDQLRRLQKQDHIRREFLAHVSHDLRTPLAGMKAYLETLQLKGDDINEQDRQQFIAKAMKNQERLSSMIDELFELARLEYGEVKIRPEVIYLSDLLSDLYASISSLASRKGIHLSVDMASETLTAYADVARLDRVLQNIIVNAIHYTPSGGEVRVEVKSLYRDHVTISVHDTGMGIAPQDLNHIFEPYYRAQDGRKIHAEGKGLGLAIAQQLLVLHGSELQVKSVIGEGTVFSFSLTQTPSSETDD